KESDRLAFAHMGDRLVAAGILRRIRAGQWTTFQPSQLPLGAWITDPAPNLIELMDSLSSALPGLTWMISITQQDRYLVQRPALEAKLDSLDYIETAWIDVNQTFEQYWEGRGKNLRQNSRKSRRKIETDGGKLSLDIATDSKSVS